ncbi:MAG: hypothetical protein ACHQ53_04160 [Polyangiales bacterium]
MTKRPEEAQRDLLETAFTPILRRIFGALQGALAAVFVDLEGECIDYVSSLDPFEAKVSAAHALVLMSALRAARGKLGLHEPVVLTVTGSARELWARRVSEEYLLVAVLEPGADPLQVARVLAFAGREFRDDVGAAMPPWDPAPRSLEVIVRGAVGWPYAPAAFSQQGVRVFISDVLGRWTEDGGAEGDELVCFRVRTEEGQELTLVHDPAGDGWLVRP